MDSRRLSNSVALALLAGCCGAGAMAAQEAKPDPIVAVFTDYELPPRTLDAAWRVAPLIVRVRIESSVRAEMRSAGPFRTPVTEHRVTVLEVFKGAASNDSELVVVQDSVEPDGSAGDVRHVSGGRVFRSGEEYVLFLERHPGRSGHGVAWGSGGAYRLDEDNAHVPGVAHHMWQFRAEAWREELLGALRLKRGQSQGK